MFNVRVKISFMLKSKLVDKRILQKVSWFDELFIGRFGELGNPGRVIGVDISQVRFLVPFYRFLQVVINFYRFL